MGDITRLLHKWREGDREAENELFALVLPNLRRLAHYLMKGERDGHKKEMDPYKDKLKPDQIDALIPYIRSLAK